MVSAKALIKRTGGDPEQIPQWEDDDFDSLYVIRLNDEGKLVLFKKENEGLNDVSERCQNEKYWDPRLPTHHGANNSCVVVLSIAPDGLPSAPK